MRALPAKRPTHCQNGEPAILSCALARGGRRLRKSCKGMLDLGSRSISSSRTPRSSCQASLSVLVARVAEAARDAVQRLKRK